MDHTCLSLEIGVLVGFAMVNVNFFIHNHHESLLIPTLIFFNLLTFIMYKNLPRGAMLPLGCHPFQWRSRLLADLYQQCPDLPLDPPQLETPRAPHYFSLL